MQRAGVRAPWRPPGRLSRVTRRSPLATRPAGRRTVVRRLVPVAVLGAALALSACQTQSPVQTDVTYDPADGVPVDLGAVQLRDLVVVGTGKGKPGVLSAAVSNKGTKPERVSFALPNSAPVYATAPASTSQPLSDTTQVQLSQVPVDPGDVVKLNVQSPSARSVVVTVPVVAPYNYYATLSPTSAPTSSPTSASSTATASSGSSSTTGSPTASTTTTP